MGSGQFQPQTAQQCHLHQELFRILQERSFFTGQFVLASGKTANWYMDCRKTALSARGAYLIGTLFYDMLAPTQIDMVGGMALGAAPLVSAVSYRSAEVGHPIDGFLVRKEAKAHGTQKAIEGTLQPWMRIALVEDVVTTGSSTARAIDIIRAQYPSIEIVGVLALVDRAAGGEAAFSSRGIPYRYLYSAQQFLQAASLTE